MNSASAGNKGKRGGSTVVFQLLETRWGLHLKMQQLNRRSIHWGWDRLQKEIRSRVPEGVHMVEYFPDDKEVVNEVNMRHFWEWNGPLPLSRS